MIIITIENYYYKKIVLSKVVTIGILRESGYIKPFTMDITIEIINTIFINI